MHHLVSAGGFIEEEDLEERLEMRRTEFRRQSLCSIF